MTEGVARHRRLTGSGIAVMLSILPAQALAGPVAGVEEPVQIEVEASPNAASDSNRAASVVTREDIERRLPRSAPDALASEPGVYIQQTSHAQASPYIRGLTGQQTAIYFDKIRLNNSTFRQGPNQYFFTVDANSLERIEVVRGSASTRYGSDALGGAILSTPTNPRLTADQGLRIMPRAQVTSRTADQEIGGRTQIELAYDDQVGFIGGVGYRDVGLLESAGPVKSPATGKRHYVPYLLADGRTQRGTGFRELTSDARLVLALAPASRLTLATYDYRQYDAPRTDRCPPQQGRDTECQTYLKQFRNLSYLALDANTKYPWLESIRASLSYQRQHEWRQWTIENSLPDVPGGTESNDRDTVSTFGTSLIIRSATWQATRTLNGQLDYGADAYGDTIASRAWQRYTDIDPIVTQNRSRGQYVDGSRYLTSGAFADSTWSIGSRLTAAAGGRVGAMSAWAAGDEGSQTQRVRKTWFAPAAHLHTQTLVHETLSWHVNVDQGFRAPNLDDLTSRQQIGPGFQYENPNLRPEKSLSYETGFRWQHGIWRASIFAFYTQIFDVVARAPRKPEECPAGDGGPGSCTSAAYRFSLQNLPGHARIAGGEVALHGNWRNIVVATANASYAIGDTPNPLGKSDTTMSANARPDRVPLSRVPPLHGMAEIYWNSPLLLSVGFAMRWALEQTRLALADESDPRIPKGGTPGYGVFDIRLQMPISRYGELAVSFENLADAPYRIHGSSINGAARSANVVLRMHF